MRGIDECLDEGLEGHLLFGQLWNGYVLDHLSELRRGDREFLRRSQKREQNIGTLECRFREERFQVFLKGLRIIEITVRKKLPSHPLLRMSGIATICAAHALSQMRSFRAAFCQFASLRQGRKRKQTRTLH